MKENKPFVRKTVGEEENADLLEGSAKESGIDLSISLKIDRSSNASCATLEEGNQQESLSRLVESKHPRDFVCDHVYDFFVFVFVWVRSKEEMMKRRRALTLDSDGSAVDDKVGGLVKDGIDRSDRVPLGQNFSHLGVKEAEFLGVFWAESRLITTRR